MEGIVSVIIGVICVIIGIFNRKGNLSMLHSYHVKRVSEEDKVPFGKMVGLGTIIIGMALTLMGGLYLAASITNRSLYADIGNGLLMVGLVLGLGISFYAMIKYNKGIF